MLYFILFYSIGVWLGPPSTGYAHSDSPAAAGNAGPELCPISIQPSATKDREVINNNYHQPANGPSLLPAPSHSQSKIDQSDCTLTKLCHLTGLLYSKNNGAFPLPLQYLKIRNTKYQKNSLQAELCSLVVIVTAYIIAIDPRLLILDSYSD